MSFSVYDKTRTGSELLAYQCVAMSALRSGWRVLRLRSPTGSRLVLGSLLVHLQLEERKGPPAISKVGKRRMGGMGGVGSRVTMGAATGNPSRTTMGGGAQRATMGSASGGAGPLAC